MRGAKISLFPKPTVGEKACRHCKAVKPLTDFDRKSSSLDGRRAACRACRHRNITEHVYRLDSTRALRLRLNNYGMTIDDFQGMIEQQGGTCACCGFEFSKPIIDHDHATGAVRALVCSRCNNWLAAIEHPNFAGWASNYLSWTAKLTPRFFINPKRMKERLATKAIANAIKSA